MGKTGDNKIMTEPVLTESHKGKRVECKCGNLLCVITKNSDNPTGIEIELHCRKCKKEKNKGYQTLRL